MRFAFLLLLCIVAAPGDGYGQGTQKMVFAKLTVSKTTLTVAAGTTLSVRGSYTITTGGTVLNRGTISLTGGWTNNGTFDERTGIVILDGGSQCIAGKSVFNNLEISSTGVTDILTATGTNKIWNTLTLSSGEFDVRGDSLILLSDATGTARVAPVVGTMRGDFTIQRYIAGEDDWRLLGSPVFEADIEGWNDDFAMSGFPGTDDPASSFTSVWTYDESDPGTADFGYIEPASTADLMGIGEGFMVWVGGPLGTPITMTIDITDSLVSGTQAVVVDYTDGPENDDEDGWNLIANPFASDILWDDVALSTSVTGFAYLRDPATQSYSSYDQSSGRTIPSHQGFWVKLTGAATHMGTVTFDEVDKTADGNNFLKTSSPNEIELTLSGYGSYNSSRIRFRADAQNAYDPWLDAFKLGSSNPNYASLSSVTTEGYNMEINSVPDDYVNFAVPLRVFWNEYQPGSPDFNLTLKVDHLPSVLSSVCVEDLLTGDMIDLTEGAQYNFYATYEQDPDARFMLHGSGAECVLSIEDLNNSFTSKVTIISSNDDIHIYFNLEETTNIEINIFNVLGELVYNHPVKVRKELVDIPDPLPIAGTYVVSVISDEITTSKKLVFGL